MKKGLMGAAFGFLAICLPWFAPQSSRAQQMRGDGFRLDNPDLFPNLSAPTLFNRELTSSSVTLAWTPLNDTLRPPPAVPAHNLSAPVSQGRNLADRLTDSLPKFDYATCEVGFLYGRSTGKFGGELKEGYIIGEVGDDKLHITVGAAFEDSSFRFPRHN